MGLVLKLEFIILNTKFLKFSYCLDYHIERVVSGY